MLNTTQTVYLSIAWFIAAAFAIVTGIDLANAAKQRLSAPAAIPTPDPWSYPVPRWQTRVIVLPTGERVLIGLYYSPNKGDYYPVAVLLPPLPPAPVESPPSDKKGPE